MELQRCEWVTDDPIYVAYHDQEWGRPKKDSQYLFEMLCLEGQQAGLSWITILKKRPAYRQAFANFDPAILADFGSKDVEWLMDNDQIIRNQLKIESIIKNARAYLSIEDRGQSFSDYIWSFVDHTVQINHYHDLTEVPAETETSRAMAKQLKKDGFSFVGPTTCYAYMQSVGMVNDHTSCFLYLSAQN